MNGISGEGERPVMDDRAGGALSEGVSPGTA
jgi:hypothetical protein